MSKKIFITGCAKSGTTLLLRMCYALENTEVLYQKGFDGHELVFDDFVDYEPTKPFTIGKRHPPAILSNVASAELDRQHDIIRKEDIGIINVVRDGRDVVLSDGNYVKPRRWIESIKQRDTYSDIIDIEVCYEELVRKPNQVQAQLEETFGLRSNHLFAEYPDYVPDWVYEWNVSVLARAGKGNKTNYGKRKLSPEGILRRPHAYKDVCAADEVQEFEMSLMELGYLK
tara:strand:- start:958 stop:1641 length:684 start_codon:yes stop_codon:yes gene_type:complete